MLPCLVASSNLLVSLKLACVNILEDFLEILLRILLPLFPDVWCASAGNKCWMAERGEGAEFGGSLCWCPGKLEPKKSLKCSLTVLPPACHSPPGSGGSYYSSGLLHLCWKNLGAANACVLAAAAQLLETGKNPCEQYF